VGTTLAACISRHASPSRCHVVAKRTVTGGAPPAEKGTSKNALAVAPSTRTSRLVGVPKPAVYHNAKS
jgi:hypothetical protein